MRREREGGKKNGRRQREASVRLVGRHYPPARFLHLLMADVDDEVMLESVRLAELNEVRLTAL